MRKRSERGKQRYWRLEKTCQTKLWRNTEIFFHSLTGKLRSIRFYWQSRHTLSSSYSYTSKLVYLTLLSTSSTLQYSDDLKWSEFFFPLVLFSLRDGGGTITTVELGQVMTTFGWHPTEPELQELIGEIRAEICEMWWSWGQGFALVLKVRWFSPTLNFAKNQELSIKTTTAVFHLMSLSGWCSR